MKKLLTICLFVAVLMGCKKDDQAPNDIQSSSSITVWCELPKNGYYIPLDSSMVDLYKVVYKRPTVINPNYSESLLYLSTYYTGLDGKITFLAGQDKYVLKMISRTYLTTGDTMVHHYKDSIIIVSSDYKNKDTYNKALISTAQYAYKVNGIGSTQNPKQDPLE